MKKRFGIILICSVLVLSLLPLSVFADEEEIVLSGLTETVSSNAKDGLYLPDVTKEMSDASYWAAKEENPDEVLADEQSISDLSKVILDDYDNTKMFDLKTWPYETYNGQARNTSNQNAVQSTLQSYYNSGVTGIHYDKDGNYYATKEEIWDNILNPIIENAADPAATESDPVRYAICTTRTTMMTVPSDEPLWEDYTADYQDKDNGNNFVHPIRVNEPLLVLSTSADGKYCLAYSIGLCDWVRTEDIAFCEDKEEWLSAFDLPSEKTLVVYADKIYTEMSVSAPETSKVLLTMGTCLELADEAEYADKPVINRWAYNNHVVWLPVRSEDGSYKKVLALIGENRKVSEGFLPLTTRNILSVALNFLGDTYGWGGMIESEDCSGFMRDVYKCFGLELAKNTSWQAAMPVYKQSLSGMETDEKAEYIRSLPAGAILVFSGHEMMYLGEENGKLYVISSVGSLRVPGTENVINVRGGMISTLDVQRRNGSTWLSNLHTALIPYYPSDYVRTFSLQEKNASLETDLFLYTGKEITPHVLVTYQDKALVLNEDYTVSYSNNIEAGTGTVTITGIGSFKGTLTKDFTITKGDDAKEPKTVYVTKEYGPTYNYGPTSTTINNITKTEKKSSTAKKANPLKVTAKKKLLSAKAKKKTILNVKKAVSISGAKGAVSFQKVSGNKKITVASNGKITVKKGLKKGAVYKIKVKVAAAGNASYKKSAKTVTLKIKIK